MTSEKRLFYDCNLAKRSVVGIFVRIDTSRNAGYACAGDSNGNERIPTTLSGIPSIPWTPPYLNHSASGYFSNFSTSAPQGSGLSSNGSQSGYLPLPPMPNMALPSLLLNTTNSVGEDLTGPGSSQSTQGQPSPWAAMTDGGGASPLGSPSQQQLNSAGGSSSGAGSSGPGMSTSHPHLYQPSPLVNSSGVSRGDRGALRKSSMHRPSQMNMPCSQQGQEGSGGGTLVGGGASQPTGARALLAVAAANSFMARESQQKDSQGKDGSQHGPKKN